MGNTISIYGVQQQEQHRYDYYTDKCGCNCSTIDNDKNTRIKTMMICNWRRECELINRSTWCSTSLRWPLQCQASLFTAFWTRSGSGRSEGRFANNLFDFDDYVGGSNSAPGKEGLLLTNCFNFINTITHGNDPAKNKDSQQQQQIKSNNKYKCIKVHVPRHLQVQPQEEPVTTQTSDTKIQSSDIIPAKHWSFGPFENPPKSILSAHSNNMTTTNDHNDNHESITSLILSSTTTPSSSSTGNDINNDWCLSSSQESIDLQQQQQQQNEIKTLKDTQDKLHQIVCKVSPMSVSVVKQNHVSNPLSTKYHKYLRRCNNSKTTQNSVSCQVNEQGSIIECTKPMAIIKPSVSKDFDVLGLKNSSTIYTSSSSCSFLYIEPSEDSQSLTTTTGPQDGIHMNTNESQKLNTESPNEIPKEERFVPLIKKHPKFSIHSSTFNSSSSSGSNSNESLNAYRVVERTDFDSKTPTPPPSDDQVKGIEPVQESFTNDTIADVQEGKEEEELNPVLEEEALISDNDTSVLSSSSSVSSQEEEKQPNILKEHQNINQEPNQQQYSNLIATSTDNSKLLNESLKEQKPPLALVRTKLPQLFSTSSSSSSDDESTKSSSSSSSSRSTAINTKNLTKPLSSTTTQNKQEPHQNLSIIPHKSDETVKGMKVGQKFDVTNKMLPEPKTVEQNETNSKLEAQGAIGATEEDTGGLESDTTSQRLLSGVSSSHSTATGVNEHQISLPTEQNTNQESQVQNINISNGGTEDKNLKNLNGIVPTEKLHTNTNSVEDFPNSTPSQTSTLELQPKEEEELSTTGSPPTANTPNSNDSEGPSGSGTFMEIDLNQTKLPTSSSSSNDSNTVPYKEDDDSTKIPDSLAAQSNVQSQNVQPLQQNDETEPQLTVQKESPSVNGEFIADFKNPESMKENTKTESELKLNDENLIGFSAGSKEELLNHDASQSTQSTHNKKATDKKQVVADPYITESTHDVDDKSPRSLEQANEMLPEEPKLSKAVNNEKLISQPQAQAVVPMPNPTLIKSQPLKSISVPSEVGRSSIPENQNNGTSQEPKPHKSNMIPGKDNNESINGIPNVRNDKALTPSSSTRKQKKEHEKLNKISQGSNSDKAVKEMKQGREFDGTNKMLPEAEPKKIIEKKGTTLPKLQLQPQTVAIKPTKIIKSKPLKALSVPVPKEEKPSVPKDQQSLSQSGRENKRLNEVGQEGKPPLGLALVRTKLPKPLSISSSSSSSDNEESPIIKPLSPISSSTKQGKEHQNEPNQILQKTDENGIVKEVKQSQKSEEFNDVNKMLAESPPPKTIEQKQTLPVKTPPQKLSKVPSSQLAPGTTTTTKSGIKDQSSNQRTPAIDSPNQRIQDQNPNNIAGGRDIEIEKLNRIVRPSELQKTTTNNVDAAEVTKINQKPKDKTITITKGKKQELVPEIDTNKNGGLLNKLLNENTKVPQPKSLARFGTRNIPEFHHFGKKAATATTPSMAMLKFGKNGKGKGEPAEAQQIQVVQQNEKNPMHVTAAPTNTNVNKIGRRGTSGILGFNGRAYPIFTWTSSPPISRASTRIMTNAYNNRKRKMNRITRRKKHTSSASFSLTTKSKKEAADEEELIILDSSSPLTLIIKPELETTTTKPKPKLSSPTISPQSSKKKSSQGATTLGRFTVLKAPPTIKSPSESVSATTATSSSSIHCIESYHVATTTFGRLQQCCPPSISKTKFLQRTQQQPCSSSTQNCLPRPPSQTLQIQQPHPPPCQSPAPVSSSSTKFY